jgi:excisionase family DNA binding protein
MVSRNTWPIGPIQKENVMSTTPRWLTMDEYATASGISYSKVKRMKADGRIPFVQDGRTVRIPDKALDFEWLVAWQQQERKTA